METTYPSTTDPSDSIFDQVIIELRKIIQAIDQNSKSLVRRVGLTGPQLVILKAITKHTEISVGDIAREVSLSQGTVTGIMERLANRDLIIRWKSGQDRRRVLVKVTEAGRRLVAQAPPLMHEDFMASFSRLPPWRQTMILSSLQQLSAITAAKAMTVTPLDQHCPDVDRKGTEKEEPPLFL